MRIKGPKKLVAALGGAILVGAAILVGVLLATRSGSGPRAVPVPDRPGFPAPPLGAVVFSRELGSDALALGVLPQPGKVLLQASVLDQQGSGVRGLTVDFTLGRASKRATACGAGCYWATVETVRRPQTVRVEVRGNRVATRWRITLPASWPPPDASALIARAGRVWRSLQSLTFRESLASDSLHVARSTWRVEAPDRLAYQVLGGPAGIIIGDRRWDRPPGGHWVGSPQYPVTQPVPFWASAVNAHVLGTATVQGKPAYRVSFFDPGSGAWFTVALDRRTLRTLDLHMVTNAHFMHDVYTSFDGPHVIRPPS